MRDITIGQYYPVKSPAHNLDPRTKIILTIMYIVTIFFVDSFVGYGIIFLALLLMILASRVPFKSVLKSVKGIMFLITFTTLLNLFFSGGTKADILFSFWVITIYKQAAIIAFKLALRLVFLVVGPTLLTLTTTPIAITDATESLLKPLNVIKFPVHEFAITMSIALRLIPTLVEETDKIIAAQKARCAEFDSRNLFKKARAMLPVLIPLIISSFRRADELAFAMDSRCYRGSKGRTKMKVLKYRLNDAAAFALFALLMGGIIALKYLNIAWLI